MFEKVTKTDVFKNGMADLADRIARTGRSMVPLSLFQGFFRELSHTSPLTGAGCDLEQILKGIDNYLLTFDVSVVTRNGDVSTQEQFAAVDGYEADSMLIPLPAVLGWKQIVEGLNDTEVNVGKTNAVLVGTAREFMTMELTKRGIGYDGAPIVKNLDTLTDQGRLDLLPWEVQSHMLTFRAGQYIIARIVAILVERIKSVLPSGASVSHLVAAKRIISNITNAYNAARKTPAMVGTHPPLVGQTGYAFHIVAVGSLALQTLMYQLPEGKRLVIGALSSASYIMMGNVKDTDTPGDLLEKVLEAILRGVELGGKHDRRDVSKRICDLVLEQLQLLQVTHALNTESVSLLQDLERHDEKAEDQLRERPEGLKQ